MHFAVAGVDHQPVAVGLAGEHFQEFFPYPFVAPPDEAAMGIAPSSLVGRGIAPGGSGAHDPKHGVGEPAVVPCDSAPATSSTWKMGFDSFPGPVRNIVSSVCGNRHDCLHMLCFVSICFNSRQEVRHEPADWTTL